MDKGVSPAGAGLSPTAEPVPVSSAAAASIPDAAALDALDLCRMIDGYNSLSGGEFLDRYPFWPDDITDVLDIGWSRAEAPLRLFIRYAQAIEARRAETQGGSVHESAVAKPCAQSPAGDPS